LECLFNLKDLTSHQMTKRKRDDIPSFHRDFEIPTNDDRTAALGSFPSTLPRPDALWQSTDQNHLSLDDLDEKFLYQPTTQVNQKIPKPRDELDWLAQVPEEAQSLQQYVEFLTTRSGKRLRPVANASGNTICLLPIITDEWTATAPDLQSLVRMTQAFFQRPATVLKPAVIVTKKTREVKNNRPSRGQQRSKTTTAKCGSAKFDIHMYNQDGVQTSKGPIIGRHNNGTNKNQFQVDSLLDRLASFRENDHKDNNFCIMGVTLGDLYDSNDDLFCAGMAYGGSKVAVFSFHRYHPHMKMSPQTWWDYGYTSKQTATDK